MTSHPILYTLISYSLIPQVPGPPLPPDVVLPRLPGPSGDTIGPELKLLPPGAFEPDAAVSVTGDGDGEGDAAAVVVSACVVSWVVLVFSPGPMTLISEPPGPLPGPPGPKGASPMDSLSDSDSDADSVGTSSV